MVLTLKPEKMVRAFQHDQIAPRHENVGGNLDFAAPVDLTELSSNQLFQMYRDSNSPEAIQILVDRHHQKLINYVDNRFNLTRQQVDAEDAVAQVLCKLTLEAHKLDIQGNFDHFVRRSVTNYCLNLIRTNGKYSRNISLHDFDGELVEPWDRRRTAPQDPSVIVSNKELAEKISQGLLELGRTNPRRAEIFQHAQDDWGYRDIAHKFGKSEAMIKWEVFQARKFLRAYLAEQN